MFARKFPTGFQDLEEADTLEVHESRAAELTEHA
jgi:hypothetical protein